MREFFEGATRFVLALCLLIVLAIFIPPNIAEKQEDDELHIPGDIRVCEFCEEPFSLDDWDVTETCCSNCYDKKVSPCSACTDHFPITQMASFAGSDGDYMFCVRCIEKNADKFSVQDPATWASDGPYNFSRIER